MNNLFEEIDPSFATKHGYMCTDGGSRGNPGNSGAGAVIYDQNKKIAHEVKKNTGIQTNNYAEYMGLIIGLESALSNNFTHLKVFLDSKLIVQQMQGLWKVKNANIKPLFEKSKQLEKQFESLEFQHIPREKNKVADALANQAMDEG